MNKDNKNVFYVKQEAIEEMSSILLKLGELEVLEDDEINILAIAAIFLKVSHDNKIPFVDEENIMPKLFPEVESLNLSDTTIEDILDKGNAE